MLPAPFPWNFNMQNLKKNMALIGHRLFGQGAQQSFLLWRHGRQRQILSPSLSSHYHQDLFEQVHKG